MSQAYGGGQSAQTIFTDDVSLQTFMDHLMKYAIVITILMDSANFCSRLAVSGTS
jgi:protein transport protein SEC23